ncbi:hypothetical protein D5086_005866 [Populus alba]|uniref:Uncharacterized protein n=1 Tax=Populus alba TaxID=43335 RepID=A0ACC4CV71_POPAL
MFNPTYLRGDTTAPELFFIVALDPRLHETNTWDTHANGYEPTWEAGTLCVGAGGARKASIAFCISAQIRSGHVNESDPKLVYLSAGSCRQ